MVESAIFLVISVLSGFGMAVVLVEKGREWPIKSWRIKLQTFFHDYVSWKFSHVLFCVTCTSFWTTLITDIILCIIGLCIGVPYFLWPLSGFITVGLSWIIIEFLNVLDKESNINVFVDNNSLHGENDNDDKT
jgi:hypothetical protein